MSETREINVHIGQIKIGRHGETLKSILGSCVGIGLIWRRKGICGLAHCLLPEAPAPCCEISGRFVSQAVPSLMALMKIRQKDIPEIEAILAGAGNMTNLKSTNEDFFVSAANARMAKKLLDEMGISIVHQDLGGAEGRRIFINCSDFSYRIKKIPRLTGAA